MAGVRGALCLLGLGAALALQSVAERRVTSAAPETQHSLMVCNAYAHDAPLNIVRASSSQSLTADDPLRFGECRSLLLRLREGEELEFKTGRLNIGTFAATGLPQVTSTLLVVPVRRSVSSLEARFRTHAFVDLDAAQVVVMDTYQGAAEAAQVDIRAASGDAEGEDLPFDAVAALQPGAYRTSLVDAASRVVRALPLRATAGSKHVVLRVGGPGTDSSAEPVAQDLVVFTQVAAAA